MCGLTPIESPRSQPAKRGTELRADRRGAGVGGVDVEPHALGSAAVGERGNRVDRRRRRRPDRRDERAGVGQVDELGPHRERVVTGHRAELELEQPGRLRGGRVRVLRADDHPAARRRGARGRERGDEAARRGVLEMAVEPRRQPEQVGEPGERHLLELLERRRGTPEDADLVQPRRQQLGEDSRVRARGGEVREVARALPVGEPRHEDLVEVTEHRGEGLARVRGALGQRRADRAGLDAREHGALAHAVEVLREPLERGSARRRGGSSERAHRRLPAISRHGRVLRICSFVSHARRAWATPSSA